MASASAKKIRPKYLSLPALLFEIRLPVPGWVSILHRISGALLFFPFVAWVLYLLDKSLGSEQGFDYVRNQYLALPLVKLGILVFIWSYCHHFCAGIRYLLLDLDIGVDLRTARITSWIVILAGLALTGVVRSQALVKRLVVGAHYGLRDWLAQRVTAAIMAVYSVIVLAVVLNKPPLTYAAWKDLFAQGWMRVATLLFAASLAWHAWVGVRDILMDYVRPDGLRLTLQILTLLLLAAYVGWAVQILFR